MAVFQILGPGGFAGFAFVRQEYVDVLQNFLLDCLPIGRQDRRWCPERSLVPSTS